MLWFQNLRSFPTQFLGLSVEADAERPALRVLYPNGDQVTEPFSTRDSLIQGAVKLQEELIRRGWWLSPEPTDDETPES